MRYDEVKIAGRGCPGERVCPDKLYSVGAESRMLHARSRQAEHPRTGINTGDAGGGEHAPAFQEEPSVTLAENQNIRSRLDFGEKRRPAALQFFSGQN